MVLVIRELEDIDDVFFLILYIKKSYIGTKIVFFFFISTLNPQTLSESSVSRF